MLTLAKRLIHFKFRDAHLLIFAKAPVEDQVKTRLIPNIGSINATKLYRLMLEQVVATIANCHLCPVTLCCTPDTEHSSFKTLQSQYAVELDLQHGRDLGEKMYNAVSRALKTARSVVVVGTDCLQLTESFLGHVLAMLSDRKTDAVITPAEDGGYVLLGLNRVDHAIFTDIEWSTERVMIQTRTALEKLGWHYRETKTMRDLDTLEDIRHVYENEHQYLLNTDVRNFLSEVCENGT